MTENSRRMNWPYPGREDDPWYDGFEDLVQAVDSSGYAAREDRGLLLTGGGTVTWTLPPGTLAWTSTVSIVSPIAGFLLQIAAGSATLSDGQVLYVQLSRFPTITQAVTAVVANQVPSTDDAYLLAVRVGARIYLRTGHSLGNGDSLSGFSPGPGGGSAITLATQEEGVEVHADTRTIDFVGDGVTASDGGPNKTTVTVPGLETQDEGVQVELPTTVLDFVGEAVQVTNPVPGKALVTIGSLEVEEEGVSVETGVVNIDFTGGGVTATVTGAGQVRVDVPGGAADRTTARIIVGNSVNGDTSSDCDYLDTGNGAQLAAAIAASSDGDDVYIRPGTYDFAAVGGPVGHLNIPTRVKVRGAGRGHTIIKTRGAGDQGAFDVALRSELEDLTVQVTLPTGLPTPRTGIIELTGQYAEIRRVNVDFMDAWGAPQAANFDPIACFFMNFGATKSKIIDCAAGLIGTMPSIWTLTGGMQSLYGIYAEGSPASIGCDIVRFKTDGGDEGIASYTLVRIRDAEISDPLLMGITLGGSEANGSEVTGSQIEMFAALAGRHGIYLYQTNECDVEGNYIEAWTGNASSYGIAVEGSDANIIAKNRLPENWGIGINLDADSDNNIVGFNNMPNCYISNAGTGNELAHNIYADFPID